MNRIRTIGFVLLATLVLAACATQPPVTGADLPGFFNGMMHGLTMPIAFIASFFVDVRMYAFPNSGWPYDFGFLTGATMLGALFFSAA